VLVHPNVCLACDVMRDADHALARAEVGVAVFGVTRRGPHLHVRGEVDLAVAPDFRAALDDPDVTAVDLAAVGFMDASGLHAIIDVRAARAARGSSLDVVNPSRPVCLLFEAAGQGALLAAARADGSG
jgi:anti-sigma B factor antagonist